MPRSVIQGGLGEVWDGDYNGLAGSCFGFGGVESQKDSFEAGEGRERS